MATAVVNSSGKNFTVSDTSAGSTIKKIYSLAGLKAQYVSGVSIKMLSLTHNEVPIISLSDTIGYEGFGNTIFGATTPDTALTAIELVLGTGGGGAGGAAATIGDAKSCFKTGDHTGWIILDGRLKSTLTATQQTQATTLGFGANIPDARDRSLIGASATKLLNSTGGAATAIIAQVNLPNINLTATSVSAGTPVGTISHTSGADGAHTTPLNVYAGTTGDGFDPNVNAGITNFQMTDRTPESLNNTSASPSAGTHTHSLTFAGSALSTHNHSIPLGGSGTALATQDPYLAVNTFVYLGG